MADPEVTEAFFETLEEPVGGWLIRVSVAGDGFESRAVPVVAAVGEVPVEGLAVIGGGAIGFLSTVPTAGARLRIGYLDEGLHDTEITFPQLPNV